MNAFLTRIAAAFVGLTLLLAVSPRGETSTAKDESLSKRLKDPAPAVRKQAALALAEANDADAIPVLIDLLAELSAAERQPIEELLTNLAGEWAPLFQRTSDDKIARRIRRNVWLAWWNNTDGETLLGFVREHTRTVQRQHLERIEGEPAPQLPGAAVRLLALRKPVGAVEALLDYLPLADEENLSEEVQTALALLAIRDGKPNVALLRALSDARATVRATAAEALAKGGGASGRTAVRKLLRDDAAVVRLRVALALGRAGDKDSVPVLIDLLTVLPDEQVGEAEAALYQLAGDSAPQVSLGKEAAGKKKCRDAWLAWWNTNGKRIEMTRLTAYSALGFTVLCDSGKNLVYEIDRHGKTRWLIPNITTPVDAVVVPGNRVLIAEYSNSRVTERDFKGNILWQKPIAEPVSVQRLANGNTFFATRTGTVGEVDRKGKEIYTIQNVGERLTAAYRLRQGTIVCHTPKGECVLINRAGKQLKRFDTHHVFGDVAGIDLTSRGRILVTSQTGGKVMEYDSGGKKFLEVNAPQAATATSLPNGHFVVASYQAQRVYELDRAGKVVWEQKGVGHIYRARRR